MPAFTNNLTPAQLASQQPPKQPLVSHVNMQLDSFLANSNIEDLRAIVRTLLATGPAGTTGTFTKIARNRVLHTAASRVPPSSSFFTTDPTTNHGLPQKPLWDAISRARALFGVGLGFESVPILASIVSTASDFTFEMDSEMEDALIVIDADIAQALQSCREQLTHGDLVKDRDAARAAVAALRTALQDCRSVIEGWGGEFPFEKSILSLEGWKL